MNKRNFLSMIFTVFGDILVNILLLLTKCDAVILEQHVSQNCFTQRDRTESTVFGVSVGLSQTGNAFLNLIVKSDVERACQKGFIFKCQNILLQAICQRPNQVPGHVAPLVSSHAAPLVSGHFAPLVSSHAAPLVSSHAAP